jgi:hypothetical protein
VQSKLDIRDHVQSKLDLRDGRESDARALPAGQAIRRHRLLHCGHSHPIEMRA